MTAKCVNPACGTPFRYLRGGKLFLVDSPTTIEDLPQIGSMSNTARFSEFFWLCEQCCHSLRIVVEKSGEIMLVGPSQRLAIAGRKPPRPDRALASAAPESRLA